MGLPAEHGEWVERCAACGNCLLGLTGGICPIARCSKQLLNGPCGGSSHGKCEITCGDSQPDCAWQLIYDKLKAQGRLHLIMEITPPKDWRTSRDGGPAQDRAEGSEIAGNGDQGMTDTNGSPVQSGNGPEEWPIRRNRRTRSAEEC